MQQQVSSSSMGMQQQMYQKDESSDEDQLTRLKQGAEQTRPVYHAPKDGEFSSFPDLHERTLIQLKKSEIKNLFPIQQQCFYPIFNREDLIARDLTGSGKTLAFALPVTEYLR